MGKNNRQRRKEKQKRKEQKKERKRNKRNNQPYQGLHISQLQNPFAELSEDDKKKFISEFTQSVNKTFDSSLEELEKLIKKYDPILLLSFLSNYFLMMGVGEGNMRLLNQNYGLTQADIELFQAFILKEKPNNLQFNIPTPDIQQKLTELLKTISTSSLHKNMPNDISDISETNKSIKFIQSLVRSHTQIVRNWGHFEQVKNFSSELYDEFNNDLLQTYGFSVKNLIDFFDYLIKKVEHKSNLRFQNFKKVVQCKDKDSLINTYFKISNLGNVTEEVLESLKEYSQEQLITLTLSHYDLKLPEIYTFNNNHVAHDMEISQDVIKSIVNNFSYKLGDLESFNSEHFFLGNPVWIKPLIIMEENKFFCPLPQLFFSFILNIFDKFIEPLDAKKLSDAKANYLENKIEEIVTRRFPKAHTVSGLKWKEGSTEYETDLITCIDSYLIIFEAKSGKISDEALRGAQGRLKKKINELLVEPNIQSKRLKEKLEYLIQNPETEDKLRENIPVDLKSVRKVLRVSVTLEYFSSLQTNIAELKHTGWIPNDYTPCPTMNLGDFEAIFDILEHPIEIINYLERREELEGTINYFGDEYDLLSAYLENHLNLAGIDPEQTIILAGMSDKIDKYFEAQANGIKWIKPKPKMNRYFEKILELLEERKPEGWIMMGSIIYRLYPDDQIKIIHMLNKLKKNVKKNWMKEGHENILHYVPPMSSTYAFSFAVFCDHNKEKRQDFLQESIEIALKADHVEYCLGIGINIDLNTPYAIIGFAQKESH